MYGTCTVQCVCHVMCMPCATYYQTCAKPPSSLRGWRAAEVKWMLREDLHSKPKKEKSTLGSGVEIANSISAPPSTLYCPATLGLSVHLITLPLLADTRQPNPYSTGSSKRCASPYDPTPVTLQQPASMAIVFVKIHLWPLMSRMRLVGFLEPECLHVRPFAYRYQPY